MSESPKAARRKAIDTIVSMMQENIFAQMAVIGLPSGRRVSARRLLAEEYVRRGEELKALRKEVEFLRHQAAANLVTLVRLREIFAAQENRGDRARRELATAQAVTLLCGSREPG
jgi:hypothetical protein